MKLKCKTCGEPVESTWNVCPNCGTAIDKLTAQDYEAVIAGLEMLKAHLGSVLTSEIDFSPEGLRQVTTYVDGVTDALKQFSAILKTFLNNHESYENNPQLLHEKKWEDSWKKSATILLLTLRHAIHGSLDIENPENRSIPSMPAGCVGIQTQVFKIRHFTDDLLEAYYNFIKTEKSEAFKPAAEAIARINKHVDMAFDEIDKVNNQLSPPG